MHYSLRWRGASLVLSTETSDGPALARSGATALRYPGEAPSVFAPGLSELARRFAAGEGDEAALFEAARAVWPDAVMTRRGGPLPRWPSTLRIGDPGPDAIWPFDAESVGLELGLRRLLKREQFSPEAAVADAAWLKKRGWAVSEPGPPDEDGRRVLFAARDASALTEAVELEAQLRREDGSSADAGRRLGEALGYPACCIEAYARVGARDDRALAEALLPGPGAAPASASTQWLNAPLGVISHTPCALTCEPTMQLTEALLAGLEARSAGFTARWRSLAARVQVVGEERTLALAVHEDVVTDAVRLRLPEGSSLDEMCQPAPELVGRTLPEIVGETDIVADHRG